jgi:hypothetical protein
VSHVPYPSILRIGNEAWSSWDEHEMRIHDPDCPVCGGDRERGSFCTACTGYAPYDEVLFGQASKAEASRPRMLATAKHWLNKGESVKEIAAVLGLSEEEVFHVNEELEAAKEGRKVGEKKFTPKGIRRANRRDRRALAARASA